jgi:hypothetical protein
VNVVVLACFLQQWRRNKRRGLHIRRCIRACKCKVIVQRSVCVNTHNCCQSRQTSSVGPAEERNGDDGTDGKAPHWKSCKSTANARGRTNRTLSHPECQGGGFFSMSDPRKVPWCALRPTSCCSAYLVHVGTRMRRKRSHKFIELKRHAAVDLPADNGHGDYQQQQDHQLWPKPSALCACVNSRFRANCTRHSPRTYIRADMQVQTHMIQSFIEFSLPATCTSAASFTPNKGVKEVLE